jgi:ATP-dependent Clp protease, protease subunit
MALENSIFMFEDFDQPASERITKEIIEITEKGYNSIDMYINSSGGYVADLNVIWDGMTNARNKGVSFSTIGIGRAYSCGAMLLLSGDKGKRLVGSNAEIFTHSVQNIGYGGEKDLEEALKSTQETNDTFAKVIEKNTPMSFEEARAFIKEDTSMNAEKAIKLGWADSVWDSVELADEIDRMSLAAAKDVKLSNKVIEAKKFLNNYNKETNMPDLTGKVTELENKLTELQNANDSLNAQVAELKTKKDEAEAKLAKIAQDAIDAEAKRKSDLIASTLKAIGKDNEVIVKEVLENSVHLPEDKFNSFAKSILNSYAGKKPQGEPVVTAEFVVDEDAELTDEQKKIAEELDGSDEGDIAKIIYNRRK